MYIETVMLLKQHKLEATSFFYLSFFLLFIRVLAM